MGLQKRVFTSVLRFKTKKLQLTSEKLLLLLLTHASSALLGLQKRVFTSVLRVTTAS